MGAEVAELLNIPHVGNVLAVEGLSNGHIAVKANLESIIIRQSLPLPCLICVEGGVNTPRLPSYKRKKQMTTINRVSLSLNELADQNPAHYGLSGSPTQVERIFPPEQNAEKQVFSGAPEELATRMASILKQRKYI